ncbi:MAG: D-glycero-beta-D-manno-heptose 1-phosphate adenylyltransferase [Crocinitomicaceae bacterium]|nr:D-glycero-beta-D-manno-heptose 1-phosphate adenylyltransferase [Crocinitomicaceae bacterium]
MRSLIQIQNKIISVSELGSFLETQKRMQNRIVFTNGCFDILHKGHVEYLAKAADLGDILVVGINSDASVKRQGKGDERPINAIDARATVLAALECVGAVIEFDDDTPLALIEIIQPDVLVKGADYDPKISDPNDSKYIVGREIVLEKGGSVEVIDFVPGFSTTNIVNKLQK